MNDGSNAPSWLFSFVDLAFLMLIAMTQLASDSIEAPELGELLVPRISQERAEELSGESARGWQLRVHPAGEALPFELVVAGGGGPREAERVSREALPGRLAELAAREVGKPVLAPHEDSRSQDLLDAASALEQHWPSRRRALVARVFE